MNRMALQVSNIRRVLLNLIPAVALVSCTVTQQDAQPEALRATSAPPPTLSAITPDPTGAAAPAADSFTNPVIDQDFPDPDVLKVDDTYYAYATNFLGDNIQTAKSTDLVNWARLDDALPVLPEWSYPAHTWAPEVTTSADGETFLMYFTVRHAASNRQCIGLATSSVPEGPFEPVGEEAFICQLDQGGSIDAASFVDDDGARYLLWKNDGNCCGQDTWIYIQQVSDDGLTLQGEPAQLIRQDQPWEADLVEAPTLWKQDGAYFLFYSANSYAGAEYTVGYAVADDIRGPYRKAAEPLLVSDTATTSAIGPGGQDIVVDADGETWLVYHSWDPTISYRRMQLDELVWEGGQPVVKGPDITPQPIP